MDCIPICISFGCPTTYEPDNADQTPRICPRCHNASVTPTKSKTWFEFCFVPLVPINTHHIWKCSICQWEAPSGQGYEPPLPGYGPPQQWGGQQWGPGPQPYPSPHPGMQYGGPGGPGGPGQYQQPGYGYQH